MAVATLPREPGDDGEISRSDIAAALLGLRFDRVVSMKFEIRPSIGLVAKDVDRLGLDIRSFKEPLTRAIKRVVIPSIRKNFDQGGRPAWTPLAEATVVQRGYSAWPILQVTGKLRRRATQFNIWDVGLTSATVRRLPEDVFYGVYHQAGSGETAIQKLSKHAPHSKEAKAILQKFIDKAIAELKKEVGHVPVGLGQPITPERIKARARGLLAEANWSMPARPFILWQDEDIVAAQAVFMEWMVERATRAGRFVDPD